MSLPLVLITGGTGFVGAHVVHQALEAGYPLRLTTRPHKVKGLKEQYGGKVDVVGISDISTGDYTEALKGVGAIIHIASPLAGKDEPEAVIDNAINGTVNIAKQAASAGVKRIVVTSSFAALVGTFDDNPSDFITEDNWNPATKEDALKGPRDDFFAYSTSKALAERALWKFADAHPEIDVTTILPPFIYGPYAPGYKADLSPGSGTNYVFYANVLPKEGGHKLGPQNPIARTVDVRDVAKAHVLALSAPATSQVGRKRLIVAGESFTWKDAIEHLAKTRPFLRSRLPDTSEAPRITLGKLSVQRAKDVLGLQTYIDWKKTVEDAADAVIRVEKESASRTH